MFTIPKTFSGGPDEIAMLRRITEWSTSTSTFLVPIFRDDTTLLVPGSLVDWGTLSDMDSVKTQFVIGMLSEIAVKNLGLDVDPDFSKWDLYETVNPYFLMCVYGENAWDQFVITMRYVPLYKTVPMLIKQDSIQKVNEWKDDVLQGVRWVDAARSMFETVSIFLVRNESDQSVIATLDIQNDGFFIAETA